jgi:hypothetical protein
MLQKFLFIGIGGSGGKTLRILRSELQWRLEEVGYAGPFPKGWQFLHIDVPDTPDGNAPDLPPQLPAGSYVGLSGSKLGYRDLDNMLLQKGPAALRHTAGWRPDPAQVAVTPAFGAGQFRAVGRTVAAAAMGEVVRALRQSLRTLSHVEVDAELEAVSHRLGAFHAGPTPVPSVAVVSSIAGGSGAGAFLDVCDALRMLGATEKWPGDSVAILYTPDVFDELGPSERPGVNANALAAIAELLAGYWNDDYANGEEFALLESAGVATARVGRRGPRFPMIVGRANDKISFAGQNDVYRAVAKSLASWTTSVQVQDTIRSSLLGNWAVAATGQVDRLGVKSPNRETPLSSLGYASVSLGRDRFHRYASQRLARRAVEQLLRGHWSEQVPEQETPEAACRRVASANLYPFLERCGLRELGPDHNQILGAIRGGEERTARSPSLRSLHTKIAAEVQGAGQTLRTAWLVSEIERAFKDHWHGFLSEHRQADETRALEWVTRTQDLLVVAATATLGEVGAPATVHILDEAMRELTQKIIPELRQMIESRRRHVDTWPQQVQGVFASSEGELAADHPLIDQALRQALSNLSWDAEAGMYDLVIGLLTDLVENCMLPLRQAIERARATLEAQAEGTPEHPSPIERWPVDGVPQHFTPAPNEVLLETVDSYPDTLVAKVKATTGAPDRSGGILLAIREIVAGAEPSEPAIRRIGDWVPSHPGLRGSMQPRSAQFTLGIGVDDLHERAKAWTARRDTAIGGYVRESLADYLQPANAEPREHRARLERFRSDFAQALSTSLPLALLDRSALLRTHDLREPRYTRLTTVLPFAPDHPARPVAKELLLLERMEERDIERLFGDGAQSRIEISTFLAAPCQPVVFDSLVGPIADEWAQKQGTGYSNGFWQWRRARPLRHFIPADPRTRLAMIRGWFTARALGQINDPDWRRGPVSLFIPGKGPVNFPNPLLGTPRVDRKELLPAVLESLALAMVESSRRGDRALEPYRRLTHLGSPAHGEVQFAELHPELLDWIHDGVLPAGAPPPDPQCAGSPIDDSSQRLATFAGYVERFLEAYNQLDGLAVDPASASSMSRAWELRTDITRALEQLRDMCQRTAAVPADDRVG